MNKLPTINTVAKEARVSRSTVSRVLNGYPIVSEEKKERVLKVISILNYEPNRIAQSLTGRKTKTIGVILEDSTNPFFSKVVKGIESELKKFGYLMILGNSEYNHVYKINLIRRFMQYRVDGIIASLIGYHEKDDTKVIQLLKNSKSPFFLINCSTKSKGIPWIENDNIKGSYLATNHLINLGHKKILFFSFNKVKGVKNRIIGFNKALVDNNLRLEDQIIIDGAISREEGYTLMNKFIENNSVSGIPSAIIATNDIVAVGIMKALKEHNVNIPEDVSIVGYDDIEMADFLQVSLTTIRQPEFEMAKIAATELINKIEKDGFSKGKRSYLMEPELIIRESTAPYRPKH